MNINDFVLKLFVSQDKLRKTMLLPSEIGEYVYATNIYNVIRIRKNRLAKVYPNNNFPAVDSVFEQAEKSVNNKSVIINVRELLNNLIDIESKFTFETDVCEVCNGCRETKCTCCGSEITCKHCGGDGEVDSHNPFAKMELRADNDIQLFENRVAPRLLYQIVNALLILGYEKVEVFSSKESPYIIFRGKDVEILLMTKLS